LLQFGVRSSAFGVAFGVPVRQFRFFVRGSTFGRLLIDGE
jgi:hypothetical protein